MRVFNLAEELEKERKKNKELEKELKSIKKNYKIQLEYDEELEIRIDKAIEYINNLSNKPNVFGHYGIDGNCKKYLLNILQGSDKE